MSRDLDPYVPLEARTQPAGAKVEAGQVSCVICQAKVPLADADVVGMGYRCSACSQRAELAKLTGGGDAASHFSASERQHLAASGLWTIYGGVAVMILGIALLGFWFLRSGIACLVGGGAMIGVGLARRNAAY